MYEYECTEEWIDLDYWEKERLMNKSMMRGIQVEFMYPEYFKRVINKEEENKKKMKEKDEVMVGDIVIGKREYNVGIDRDILYAALVM